MTLSNILDTIMASNDHPKVTRLGVDKYTLTMFMSVNKSVRDVHTPKVRRNLPPRLAAFRCCFRVSLCTRIDILRVGVRV